MLLMLSCYHFMSRSIGIGHFGHTFAGTPSQLVDLPSSCFHIGPENYRWLPCCVSAGQGDVDCGGTATVQSRLSATCCGPMTSRSSVRLPRPSRAQLSAGGGLAPHRGLDSFLCRCFNERGIPIASSSNMEHHATYGHSPRPTAQPNSQTSQQPVLAERCSTQAAESHTMRAVEVEGAIRPHLPTVIGYGLHS